MKTIPTMRALCALVLLAGCASVVRAAPVCAGVVYADANANDQRDAGEAGVADVAISDGDALVRSDAQGRYRLPAGDEPFLFVVKPADYALARRIDGLPDLWRPRAQCSDVALRPTVPRAGPYNVLVFADPQPKSKVDVGYYERDIVAPLRGRTDADFGLSLGDISDDTALYPAIKQATASLALPWLHVPGNHDTDTGARDDAGSLSAYHAAFGPDTYAWETPGANVVMLDDVIATPNSKPAYVGGLREAQFRFLAAYLRAMPKDRLLVIGAHIPFFDTAKPGQASTFRPHDRERLFALLRDVPHVLLLSAHLHTQRHVFHDASDGWHGAQPLHEYNVGAACGAFWSGVKDTTGIPVTTMADGTPNGYAVLTVKPGGAYALAWYNARDAADTQLGLHAPKVLRRGAYPAWGVYANVYMALPDARVEYRVDGGAWKPMTRVLQPDPALLAENARDDAADALRGYDRSPEATPSQHLWRGALPTDLAAGEHGIDVRTFDPWRGELSASIRYTLAEKTE